MPKPKPKAAPTDPNKPPKQTTIEVDGYLKGIALELAGLCTRYAELTRHWAEIEARMDLTEKHVRTTRDHLQMALKDAETCTIPPDWTKSLNAVEFVGMRLADACSILLKRNRRMSPERFLYDLNSGMYRFRTSSPLREIHGALLRHPHVVRESTTGDWIWTGEQPTLPMPIKVVDNDEEEAATA